MRSFRNCPVGQPPFAARFTVPLLSSHLMHRDPLPFFIVNATGLTTVALTLGIYENKHNKTHEITLLVQQKLVLPPD